MAAVLSISVDTLDRLRKLGCPHIPVPDTKKVLFDPDDLVRWMKEQMPRQTATEEEASKKLESLLQN